MKDDKSIVQNVLLKTKKNFKKNGILKTKNDIKIIDMKNIVTDETIKRLLKGINDVALNAE